MTSKKHLEEFKKTFRPESDNDYLRQQLKEEQGKTRTARIEAGKALELSRELKKAVEVCEPTKIEYIKSKAAGSPVTHVLHLTDMHYGKVVSAYETDGFGTFSPEICEARMQNLACKIVNKTKVQRNGYNVPRLHIIITGDMIQGELRRTDTATNAFPPPVQSVKAGYLLGEVIMLLAAHFEEITVEVITDDNHGRLAKKPESAQAGLNNWGYVVAEVMKLYCSRQSNVEFRIHAKPSSIISIGPEKYLTMHGHQIKAWQGKPYYSFDRRAAMEAVKRMGVPEKAFTKLLMGHWHHGFNGDIWMLGGSVSGTDEYDHECGRFSKPHQTAWFVDDKHGEFDWSRWWLQ